MMFLKEFPMKGPLIWNSLPVNGCQSFSYHGRKKTIPKPGRRY